MNSPNSSKGKSPLKGDQVITKFFTPKSTQSRPDTLKTSSCPPHVAKRSDRHGSGDHLTAKKLHLKPESSGDCHMKSPSSHSHHHRHHHGHHHHAHRRRHESESSQKSRSSSNNDSSSTPVKARHSDKRSRSHSGSSERSQGSHHKLSRPHTHSNSTAKAKLDLVSQTSHTLLTSIKQPVVSLVQCDPLLSCDRLLSCDWSVSCDKSVSHQKSKVTSTDKSRDSELTDNSDDDDLLEPPSVLLPLSAPSDSTPKSKKTVSATTSTPSKDTSDSQNEVKSQTSEVDQCKEVKLTITLDMLLEEKKATDLRREELGDKGEELKEFIRQGGIENLSITTSEDDLQPEHREQIRKLEMCRKEIMHRQPGETVFQPGRFGCLFSFPDTLTLASCGFVPGTSFLDTQLATLPPDLLVQFLCSGTVQLCFHAVSCHKQFLSWTFQLLSVHRGGVEGLFTLLYDVLLMKTGKGSTWVPSVSDVIRVFVNYGATFEDLCPQTHLLTFSSEDLQSTEDKENVEEGQGDHHVAPLDAARTYGCENLQLVIQVISHALTLRPHLYSVNDLMTLTSALLKVALDVSLTEGMLAFDFQECLSAALNAFSTDDWSAKAIELCYNLSSLTTHHHNRVHLVAILPPGVRGQYLQRRLAYVMLQQLVFANSRPNDLTDFKVRQLFGVMQTILSQAHTDFYQLSSLLALINLCVGSETLKTAEREDLRQLTDMLRRMIGSVREYIHVLDRTLVKDVMVRLSNKWTFMLRDMGPKQRSLFEWTQHPSTPPQKLAVEQVQCSQDETDNETDQSEHVAADQSEHVAADQSEHPITDTDNKMPGVEGDGAGQEHSEKHIVSTDEPGRSDTTSDTMDQSEHTSIPVSQSDHLCSISDHTDVGSVPTKHSGHSSHLAGHSKHSINAADKSHCSKNVIAQSHHSNKAAGQSRSSVSNDTVSNNTSDQSHHSSQSDRASKQATEPLVSSQSASMAANV